MGKHKGGVTEGGKGKDKRERIIVVLRSPCQENWRAQVSAGVGMDSECASVNGTGNSPSLGRPTPGVVKQDKSSGGSVTRPKHVRTHRGSENAGARGQ